MMKRKPVVFITGTHSDALNDNNMLDLWWLPVIKTEILSFDKIVLKESFDWIIFTSRNAVEYFVPFMDRVKVKNIASIGSKTSHELKTHDIEPNFESEVFSQEGFIDKFPVEKGLKILYPASQNRRPKLENYLRGKACDVTSIDLYRPVDNIESIHYLFDNLHRADALTFASPSAVRAIMENPLMTDEMREILNDKILVCIGPVTNSVLESYGFKSSYPDVHTNEETIKLLCKLLEVS